MCHIRYATPTYLWHNTEVPTISESVQTVVELVRLQIAQTLRDRVIGNDAEAKQAVIMTGIGPRWFEETSVIHRVHSDSSMFIGGMRALLLQSLHPLVMAGVAQHSNYKADPWGRLQRTAEFVAVTSFGPADMAQRAVDQVVAVHKHVTGTTSDGRSYSASDPHLLRWVHVAEVDSFLSCYQAYGAVRLSPQECDSYVADMAVIARKLSIPAPPTSVQSLRDQIAGFRHELKSTPECRDAAKYLLITPPLDALARIPYSLITASAVAILPIWARVQLQLPWFPLTEKVIVRPVGNLVASTIRWATSADFAAQATR